MSHDYMSDVIRNVQDKSGWDDKNMKSLAEENQNTNEKYTGPHTPGTYAVRESGTGISENESAACFSCEQLK